MELFSLNSFVLGMFIFLGLSLGILIFAWLCSLWKVKIQEIGVFSSPWSKSYKIRFNGIEYILGWLPTGAHVKPLGVLDEDFVNGLIQEQDRPFTFSNLSPFKKRLFYATNYIVWLFIFIVALYGLTPDHNIIRNFITVESYACKAIVAAFNSKANRTIVASNTALILLQSSKILFALLLFINYYFIAYPIFTIMGWLVGENKKGGKFVKWLAVSGLIFLLYVILWVIPSFFFSFFAAFKILSYLISLILGAYLVGLLLFAFIVLTGWFSSVSSR